MLSMNKVYLDVGICIWRRRERMGEDERTAGRLHVVCRCARQSLSSTAC